MVELPARNVAKRGDRVRAPMRALATGSQRQ
jgi:hypothetical protein